jgi:hypothetical protein
MIMTEWRKSSYSTNNGGENCVEVTQARELVTVRDTTNRTGSSLEFTASAWSVFLGTVKRG